ncbi:MAG: Lrp/AsnC ligand binding domain-containing protein [Candidatus Lokiarchaeota archaeon]|nr:Lrp/AsnC ligand binding domain-containing protein [Candidatus Harpocratesius repetitus]
MGKLTAFCFLQIERNKRDEVQNYLLKIPQIKAYYRLTGDYNGMIEIEVEDTDGIYELYSKHIDNLPGIQETYTQVVVKKFTLK